MDRHMYHEYRIHQLVDETMESVLGNASSSFDSEEGSVRQVYGSGESDEKEETENEEGRDGTYLARAHWIQLQKTNRQGVIMQSTFSYLIDLYPQTRPIWQFGKTVQEGDLVWEKRLRNDFYFRHHCASVQAAITMIMENKDDEGALTRVLHEMGAHHFFYDAYEPHLELFEEAILHAMRKHLREPDQLDEEMEKSWKELFRHIKRHMVEGIAIQRESYLKQAITHQEYLEIVEMWTQVDLFGMEEAGIKLCTTAIETYVSLLKSYNLTLPIPLSPNSSSDLFKHFSELTMAAFDLTINSYDREYGFSAVPHKLSDYAITCMILDVCPSLVRKAFMEGLMDMLKLVLARDTLAEGEKQIWCKMYRVVEQSILINIIEY